MEFLRRKELNNRQVNLALCYVLVIMAILHVMAMGRALATVVSNFKELKSVIELRNEKIDIKQNIIFEDSNGINIDYDNLTISGPEESIVNLDGNGRTRLLMVVKNLQNIWLENLNFIRGSYSNNVNGGAAIILNKKTIITMKNVSFSNNKIQNGTAKTRGGAICSYGELNERNTLIFMENTNFSDNESTAGYGGAIYALFSELTFSGGKIEFTGNKSFLDGGAIYTNNSSLTFEKLATFENNSSRNFGGAIFALNNVSIEFRDGLRLIENTTEDARSGAIYMYGLDSKQLVTINIIQDNLLVPTEFRGNRSGNGRRNVIYMKQHSRLNFIMKKGSVNIFDVVSSSGDVKSNNILTIGMGVGWFNLEKGGSLENIKVVNGGNLKLAGESRGFNLIDFTNSGIIRFEILPGGINAKIRANSITLNAGTVLEIVAIKGQTYRAGESYAILAIEGNYNTIGGQEHIKLTVLL
ncbi:MAG: hypothetical protein LBB13_02295, partial [Rickettsiales bacterium]|nr:hypothetical protein [Rickettsiales bacterium]